MINLTDDTFISEVIESDKVTVVDFWADWCGPCKMLTPVLSELAEDYNGEVKFCKANIEDVPDMSNKIGITNVPFIAIYKDGQIVKETTGVKPKKDIKNLIDEID